MSHDDNFEHLLEVVLKQDPDELDASVIGLMSEEDLRALVVRLKETDSPINQRKAYEAF